MKVIFQLFVRQSFSINTLKYIKTKPASHRSFSDLLDGRVVNMCLWRRSLSSSQQTDYRKKKKKDLSHFYGTKQTMSNQEDRCSKQQTPCKWHNPKKQLRWVTEVRDENKNVTLLHFGLLPTDSTDTMKAKEGGNCNHLPLINFPSNTATIGTVHWQSAVARGGNQ